MENYKLVVSINLVVLKAIHLYRVATEKLEGLVFASRKMVAICCFSHIILKKIH